MDQSPNEYLKQKLGDVNFKKLMAIDNIKLHEFVAHYIKLCNPAKIFVCDDSPGDIQHLRDTALKNGEERKLAVQGHTIHYDNAGDQGRDKKNTGILVSPGDKFDDAIETKDRESTLKDLQEIFTDVMKGKEVFVCFFCLGPTSSEFSIPCVQMTDSSYVAHSETILYRPGYKEWIKQGSKAEFFKFIHSQGELDARKTCKNLDKRRIMIDLKENIVYSANTQYGGNTIGLKKLAMRLAIKKGSKEGWLTEHMLLMGIHGPKNRVTYFTGAFPSLCGKTSTAMLEGETIVGDDIAYLRKKKGEIRSVNVEKGMFGIIQGINSKDDISQWNALHSQGEIILSNVLLTPERGVHWIGKDGEVPSKGENHTGEWTKGKKDANGKEITCSHPNARFTIALKSFDNLDPNLDNPEGVVVGGMVYGGRDSDTSVPVEECFDWEHGIITKGASLESETTAATLGKEGVRAFNPMSNLDFLSVDIGQYIQINLDFAKGISKPPKIFGVNYFLKGKDGEFLNEKTDKRVWYKWMEKRIHGEVVAIEAPTGRLPKYDDLKKLFAEVLDKEYTQDDYVKQFTTRIPENLAKIERITTIYKTKILNPPTKLFGVLEEQRKRLLDYQKKYGDYVSPDRLG
ncbi:MAG: phosphoenolpyruvate carboxykinase (GTP) [bacterium]